MLCEGWGGGGRGGGGGGGRLLLTQSAWVGAFGNVHYGTPGARKTGRKRKGEHMMVCDRRGQHFQYGY